MKKKLLSLLLALTMCLSLLPMGVLASEEPAETEIFAEAADITESGEEPAEPAGMTEPSDGAEAPMEEAEASAAAEEPAEAEGEPAAEEQSAEETENTGENGESAAGPEGGIADGADGGNADGADGNDESGADDAGADGAGEDDIGEDETLTMTIPVDAEDLPDNDALFAAYIESLMYDSGIAAYAADYSSRVFSGAELSLYNYIKGEIKKIANGTRSSTVIYVPDSYISAISTLYGSQSTVRNNLKTLTDKITTTLMAECPAEMYWFDKTSGTAVEFGFRASGSGYVAKSVSVVYLVSADYNTVTDPFYYTNEQISTTNAASIRKAVQSIENAKSIAAQIRRDYATDYERMEAARDKICDLVEYDYAAVYLPTYYGDPWQLISIFDNDSSTDVVCEGYSKGFLYLCDLALDNAVCYCVTGDMDGGPHMWNVVRFEGANYLVDVTNCDSIDRDELFLVGADSGSMEAGYTVAGISYVYDADCFDTYGHDASILALSMEDYARPCGKNLTWKLKNGVLTVSGTGAMYGYDEKDPPWYKRWEDITAVVISSGVTSIGAYAFGDCPEIEKVTIPASVTSIGEGAFALCTSLESAALSDGVTDIGAYAFLGCSGLTGVTVPASVTAIGEGAFYACESLKTVMFLGGMPRVSDNAKVFGDAEATAYYYEDTSGWAAAAENDALDAFGAYLTWQSMGSKYLTSENGTATVFQTGGGAWGAGVTLEAAAKTDTGVSAAVQEKKGIEKYTVYDLALMKNGAAVTGQGDYTVSLAVPEGYDSAKCAVFRQEADGTLTNMKAVCTGGAMRFAADSFGTYIVAELNVIRGDVNGDGAVNAKDVTVLFQYVNKQRSTMPREAAADVNDDDAINAKDVTRLFQYANKQIAEL